MHFGIVTPPVPGHLHPFGALGRELIARGHRATVIHLADLEPQVLSEGLEFTAIGQTDHPHGSLPVSLAKLGQLQGLAALRFTIQAVRKTTEMICRDAPDAIRAARIDMLLVDQTEPAGGTVAEHLGLPFITICNALMLNREPGVPPPFTPWAAGCEWWRQTRNRLGYAVSARFMAPVTSVVAKYRREWNLPKHHCPEDSFSSLAQISQQIPEFDFPRVRLPETFHYAGPFRDTRIAPSSFPWDRLDPARTLVYASLGTLQHSKAPIFQCIAEACAGLPQVQLVLAGGETQSRPGEPICVAWAPQAPLIQRAGLVLTHGGLNTVLDALRFGVPTVVIPIGYEQPAIAARVEWTRAGRSLPLNRLDVARLRTAIRQVLSDSAYSGQARRMAAACERAGGAERAASLIERLAARSCN